MIKLSNLIDDGPQHLEAGAQLVKHVRKKTVAAAWPSDAMNCCVFVPALTLSTPRDTLAQYGRQRSHSAVDSVVTGGHWVDATNHARPQPSSDELTLPRRLQPLIGNVNVDEYVSFLCCYRGIVEAHASALTKLAALDRLGRARRYRDFVERHTHHAPEFPLERFNLDLNLLPGVGQKVRTSLRLHALTNTADIAAVEHDELSLVIGGLNVNARRMIDEAGRLVRRAAIATTGERLAPRIDAL